MKVSGKRKAAMLLSCLDASTAESILRGQPQEIIQEVALELSHLDVSLRNDPGEAVNIAKEFCADLQKSGSSGLHIKSFVDDILQGSAGKERAAEMRAEMQKALLEKDPFMAIASANPSQIATALEGEPPQAVALVLTSIPPKMSTEVLSRLSEEISLKAVWRMSKPGDVSPRTVRRVGELICKRLVEMTSDDEGSSFEEALPTEILRRVAIILSGLTKEKRDTLIEEIDGKDEDTAKMVKALMVTWEDIAKVEDRSLQESLRKVDASVLAKALYNCDPMIAEKVRSNISGRAADMVDEETTLMGEPRKKEVLQAREEVVNPLREANEAEELLFIEGED